MICFTYKSLSHNLFFFFIFYLILLPFVLSYTDHHVYTDSVRRQLRVPRFPLPRSPYPHLHLPQGPLHRYQPHTATRTPILSATHTLLDMGTHTDMPTRIRMGGIPPWRLNLPVAMPLSLDLHRVVRPRSRGWIRRARGGRQGRVVLRARWRRGKIEILRVVVVVVGKGERT